MPTKNLKMIKIRVHPSEKIDKYQDFFKNKYSYLPIKIDSKESLEKAIASSDAAFGCETQALIASIKCGIPSLKNKRIYLFLYFQSH